MTVVDGDDHSDTAAALLDEVAPASRLDLTDRLIDGLLPAAAVRVPAADVSDALVRV